MSLHAVADDWRRTILCIRSCRSGVLLDHALAGYECCVVHDARVACRKAKLGAFDLYLAVDPYSPAAGDAPKREPLAGSRQSPAEKPAYAGTMAPTAAKRFATIARSMPRVMKTIRVERSSLGHASSSTGG